MFSTQSNQKEILEYHLKEIHFQFHHWIKYYKNIKNIILKLEKKINL